MADRPHVACLMISSIDGRLHPSCYTASPDGTVDDWNALYEEAHASLEVDAWIIGRVTMAEMAKGEAHPGDENATPPRPVHKADGAAKPFAIAPDSDARLHFGEPDVGGDHVIVLLGKDVSKAHLAELVRDGVSYIIADDARVDLAAALATLKSEFGIERLALEGGGGINGAMIESGLVDTLDVIVVPALDGAADRQGIVISPTDGLKGKIELSLVACEPRAHGAVMLRYDVAAAKN